MDVARRIADFNQGRDPERLAMKLAKMRSSPFIFLRGACHLFYERLPAQEPVFTQAPAVWLCGDLHLENFGSYKGDNRLAYFDINDFDEAALGPCTWDLVRFLVSVMLGLLDQSRSFIDGYAAALQDGKARWVDRDASEGLVQDLLASLRARKRADYLDSRTTHKSGPRRLKLGRRALEATEAGRATVTTFLRNFAQAQPDPDFFRVLDVARRIAGTGSLGVDRYVVLVEGKGSPDGNYLLDLKEAMPSSPGALLSAAQPAWASEAARVVACQQRCQGIPMAFLNAVAMEGRPYILRGLQPSEDRVDLAGWNGAPDLLEGVVRTMAQIVGPPARRRAARLGHRRRPDGLWRPARLARAPAGGRGRLPRPDGTGLAGVLRRAPALTPTNVPGALHRPRRRRGAAPQGADPHQPLRAMATPAHRAAATSRAPMPLMNRPTEAGLQRSLNRRISQRSVENQAMMPRNTAAAKGMARAGSRVTSPVACRAARAAVQVTMNVGLRAVMRKPPAKLRLKPLAGPGSGGVARVLCSIRTMPRIRQMTTPTSRDAGSTRGWRSRKVLRPQKARSA